MAVAPPRRPGADREAEYSGSRFAPIGFQFGLSVIWSTRPDVWTVYFVKQLDWV